MQHAIVVIVCILLAGCGGRDSAPPPEEVVLAGDTAQVRVPGSADVQGGEMENIRWEQPEPRTTRWLLENGFEHRSTTFDTERMQAIGYESFVSEDQTGVRLYGISIWTRSSDH